MEILGDAPPAPTTEEMIAMCGEAISKVMLSEIADDSDSDRVYLLWQLHKNYLYYRDLQLYAPSIYQGMADFSSVAGVVLPPFEDDGSGTGDYSQNFYRGYCRKLEAVLGTRMPNAIAVPDNGADENDIRAANSANDSAEYIRQKCGLQMLILQLVFGLYNFGTQFWNIEWVEDGDKNGWKEEPKFDVQDQKLGGSGFDCPQCGAAHETDDPNSRPDACPACQGPMQGAQFRSSGTAKMPVPAPPTKVAKGALEITLHDASEISVPLESESIERGVPWLVQEREKHKSILLKKWGKALRDAIKAAPSAEETVSSQLARNIRCAFGSPIGIFRSYQDTRWTERTIFWPTAMYELLDEDKRDAMLQTYPHGCKITFIKGAIMDMEDYHLDAHWQECKPEPSKCIMADPLGNDWTTSQDLLTNTLNQANETIERSNDPGMYDATRIDSDAIQRKRDSPTSMLPVLPRAGQPISDSIYRPEPVKFSDQIPPFRAQVRADSEAISGLTEAIWGGDNSDPTARQTELKTNAAIRGLGIIWVQIGKSLEKVYEKAVRLLGEFEDGVISFSRKDQFGSYSQVAVVTEDLRNGNFHFEADEAVPMTWGQQRDLLMWMLDKPAPLLTMWGFDDPLNIPEFKRLLGMPGERTPLMDDRNRAIATIGSLAQAKPVPGPPGPPDPQTGQPTPGQPQASVQPNWEDNHDFCAKLAKAWLQVNFKMQEQNPDGYDNVRLWGQAQEQAANQPAPPPPVKGSVAVSLKGEDLGDPAVTAALIKTGIIQQGTQTQGDAIRQQELQTKQAAKPPAPPSGPMAPPSLQ